MDYIPKKGEKIRSIVFKSLVPVVKLLLNKTHLEMLIERTNNDIILVLNTLVDIFLAPTQIWAACHC